MDKLPLKKQVGPVLLGEKIDTMVQEYLKKVCEAGGARGFKSHSYCYSLWDIENFRLKEFGGYVDLKRHWPHSYAGEAI